MSTIIPSRIVFIDIGNGSHLSTHHSYYNRSLNLHTIIHKNESWYQEKTEPERVFKGVIKQHQVQSGPNTRTASAKYSLTTRESGRTTLMSIYSPNVEEILSRFVEKEVILYGKFVDLSGEGFDQELWIGSIDKMDD